MTAAVLETLVRTRDRGHLDPHVLVSCSQSKLIPALNKRDADRIGLFLVTDAVCLGPNPYCTRGSISAMLEQMCAGPLTLLRMQ